MTDKQASSQINTQIPKEIKEKWANQEEEKEEHVKLTNTEIRSKSSELFKLGYFIMKYTERGGKNEKLLIDMEKDYVRADYYRFKRKDMDLNQIMPLTEQTLKYP